MEAATYIHSRMIKSQSESVPCPARVPSVSQARHNQSCPCVPPPKGGTRGTRRIEERIRSSSCPFQSSHRGGEEIYFETLPLPAVAVLDLFERGVSRAFPKTLLR